MLLAQSVELLNIPLYDNDVLKLLVRLALNSLFLTLIVRIYMKNAGKKDYLFTYCMLNFLVFFICFTLKKFELGTGMALGLFAIFSILRYRTDAIPIREMSYLFIVITVAVINSLSNNKMSYAEIAITNFSIVFLASFLERLPLLQQELRQQVLYEKIDLITPEKHNVLLADLQERTGLEISRLELGQIDFLRDTVIISVFYYPHLQQYHEDAAVQVSRKVTRR